MQELEECFQCLIKNSFLFRYTYFRNLTYLFLGQFFHFPANRMFWTIILHVFLHFKMTKLANSKFCNKFAKDYKLLEILIFVITFKYSWYTRLLEK